MPGAPGAQPSAALRGQNAREKKSDFHFPWGKGLHVSSQLAAAELQGGETTQPLHAATAAWGPSRRPAAQEAALGGQGAAPGLVGPGTCPVALKTDQSFRKPQALLLGLTAGILHSAPARVVSGMPLSPDE